MRRKRQRPRDSPSPGHGDKLGRGKRGGGPGRLGEEGHSIRIAQVPPFRLGEAMVDPPRRLVSRGERSVILEPRMMQVLVLLAEARGEVVSRDELIARCWGGRIVVENAINRVISRLRQTGAELGGETFRLETITKVGYRLVVGETVEAPPADPPFPWPTQERPSPRLAGRAAPVRMTRRGLIAAGTAATMAGAAGAWLWFRKPAHVPPAEAVELHRRAQIAQRQGQPEQVRQAIAFFRRATEIDPLYAEAWGGLALCYRHILEGYGMAEMAGLPGLIESAARRALALDPDNGDARLALAIVKPWFRNWGPMERDVESVAADHPRHWFALAQLGIGRYEMGRWRDGLAHTDRQIEVEPLIPIPRAMRARALWSLGRLLEAEAEYDAAVQRWPGNAMLWQGRFAFLVHSGRPGAATAFAMNPETQPERFPPEAMEALLAFARAIERRNPADIAASVAAQLRDNDLRATPTATAVFTILGRGDLAFQAMERYFFGAPAGEIGPTATAPGPYDRRYTYFLFTPPLAPLRRDRRFAALLDRLGLESYWRESGTLPDYRRT